MGSPALAEDAAPTIEELLTATDDVQRGEQSRAVMSMHVKTRRYERTMKMEAWAKGTEKTLVRILEPAKDAGVATLKVDDNLWNYLPKVDRTLKVAAGQMSGSWMGSHFTNDDLVKENRLSEEFTCVFDSEPEGGVGTYVIGCTPKPDAPVVWGKVVAHVTHEKIPEKVEYFDEKGELVRTMAFLDVQDIDGRMVPMQMQLTPHDKEGEFTRVSYDDLSFAVELEDSLFSLQSLKD